MGQVVSFQEFTPPERFDALPWTQVRIQEASTALGPWTTIDTIDLDPVDSDPTTPAERSFTTENGTGTDLWYRVIFLDASGDATEPSRALRNVPESVEDSEAFGPCGAWIDGADVSECCDVASSSDGSLLDTVAQSAGEILFELSGRIYSGTCIKTVRPCNTRGSCGFQTLSLGHIVDPWGGAWDGSRWRGEGGGLGCGCQPLSRILLPGYPVREIVTVRIDGGEIDPSGYRLDRQRWLTRKADAQGRRQLWPACQRLDLDDTEAGTFAVSYTWGTPAPLAGVEAAKQLACELYKACPGTEGECKLPAGTVRVTRAGLTVERKTLSTFLTDGQTGLVLVDAFLGTYKAKANRRPAVWSPDGQEFAQEVGQ